MRRPTIELDEDHNYTMDGRPALGVTGVIKESGLADWRWVLEHYRDRGSRAHKAVHLLAEGDLRLGSCSDDIVGYLISAQRFLDAHRAKTIESERRVGDPALGCCGTLDRLVELTSCSNRACCNWSFVNMLTMLDWKSSKIFHPATVIQVSAYSRFYFAETGVMAKRHCCVLLDEAGGPAKQREYGVAEQRNAWDVFRGALLLCQWREENHLVSPYATSDLVEYAPGESAAASTRGSDF